MKLLGLACGRKMDKTEILVKEALMAAEESGIDVAFIRLQDLSIKPCRGCAVCLQNMFKGEDATCIIEDDLPILDEQIMECDGLILGSPVYTMAPSGILKILCERYAPSHDVCFRTEAKKIAVAQGKDTKFDDRWFKNRVGAFISVGGAKGYVDFALPLMNLFTHPLQIKIVDQVQFVAVWYGSGYMDGNDSTIKRVRKLGQNIASNMGKPLSEVKWMGDATGTCPVCHSNLLVITNRNPVRCPVCGINGELKLHDGKISVYFTEEEQKRSRLMHAGLLEHWFELKGYHDKAEQNRQIEDKTPVDKFSKYKGYGEVKLK